MLTYCSKQALCLRGGLKKIIAHRTARSCLSNYRGQIPVIVRVTWVVELQRIGVGGATCGRIRLLIVAELWINIRGFIWPRREN